MSEMAKYELERRTGGLHPKTEETFFEPPPKVNYIKNAWDFVKDNVYWVSITALVLLCSWAIVNGKIPTFNFTKNIDETKIVEVEKIVEVPKLVEVVKYVDKVKYVNKVVYKTNPINAELQESNRILIARAEALDRRLKSLNHEYLLNKKIIDDFYNKPMQKGWVRTLNYKSVCK